MDPEHSSLLTAARQQTLASVTPDRVLWDVNRDGRTDLSCPGSSPVIRGPLLKGNYEPTATIVFANSVDTGRFFTLKKAFDFPSYGATHPNGRPAILGKLPKDQPLWCRNTMTPPPDPKLGPCTSTGRIGRVKIVGDLCPMDVRAIAQGNIDLAPPAMRATLKKVADAINAAERRRDEILPGFHPGFKTAFLQSQALPTLEAKGIAATAINTNASLSGLRQAQFQAAKDFNTPQEQQVVDAYNAGPGTDNSKAEFALDNLYSASGTVLVNGIAVTPGVDYTEGGEAQLQTLFAPSAVGESFDAVKNLKGMLVSSPRAKQALEDMTMTRNTDLDKVLSEVPKNPQGRPPAPQRPQQLLDDIDLGPFQLADAPADIKLSDDGSATVHATAEFPALASPAGDKITTDIVLKGDVEGHLVLQGLRFRVSHAFLGPAEVKGLDVQYVEGTLAMSGELVFPGLGAGGIEIRDVVISNDDKLLGFGVSYTPPPGTGIPVGPGVFMNSLGGGFTVRPNHSPFIPERTGVFAKTSLSALVPGNYGGCPTVGLEGEAGVYWNPSPWNVHVQGDVSVACITFGGMRFDLWGNGVMDVSAFFEFAIPYIVEFEAAVGGYVRTNPNAWQVTLDGEGEIGPIDLPLGINSIDIHSVLSSKGFAVCGRYIIAAGAALNFVNGLPPLNPAEFFGNIEIFEGCNLGPWRVRNLRQAFFDGRQALTQAQFEIPADRRPRAAALPGLRRLTARHADVADGEGLRLLGGR